MSKSKNTFTLGSLSIIIIITLCSIAYIYSNNSQKDIPPIKSANTTETVELTELINESEGYSFNYPPNWNALSIQNNVEVSSPNNKGKIIIDSSGDTIKFIIPDEELLSPENKSEIQNVLAIIQNSFKTIEKKELTKQEINDRYKQTIKGDN